MLSQMTKDLLAWLRLREGARVPVNLKSRLVNDLLLDPSSGVLTKYGVLEVRALATEGDC